MRSRVRVSFRAAAFSRSSKLENRVSPIPARRVISANEARWMLSKPRQRGARFSVGNDRRRHDVRIADELADDLRTSLGNVELYQAARVQIQRHRRSSSTIDDAVLFVMRVGRLAPTGLPPFQCARPSATS